MPKGYVNYLFVFFLFSLYSCEKPINRSLIPATCRQCILVLTDSAEDAKGFLYRFEKDGKKSSWRMIGKKTPVILGRNGLGWGRGIDHSSNPFNYPIKKEGDGRSPAGIFHLSLVFASKPKEQMRNLKMPYLHITEMTECVDDVNSEYYNQVVSRDKIETEKVDWESSEKMSSYAPRYELGVVVEHNTHPVKKKCGSCIFLHNWSNPNETTSGCTAMDPAKMQEIVYWLDEDKQPVLIQLTQQSYIGLIKRWGLPEIINRR